jgi:mannose-6-phosphate isomerase-like protein (cupin superfamily)
MVPFNPSTTYASLASEGVATTVSGGHAFWSLPASEIEKFGHDWLISEFEFDSDWPNWEVHPHGDEFVYLFSGSVVMLMETSRGITEVPMLSPAAIIVPRGVWHTAKVLAPSRMLHVTRGLGTELRTASPTS